MPRRINRAIELLAEDQAIYYTGGHSGHVLTSAQGREDAHVWADYINVGMEHGAFDMAGLAEYLRGLAEGGPAAGVTTVLPDGWEDVWHPFRAPDRKTRLDDVRFLNELSGQLEEQGAARARPVFLAGVSNGARFAEHVARHGLLPVAGLFVVVSTIREFSRQAQPVPRQQAAVPLQLAPRSETLLAQVPALPVHLPRHHVLRPRVQPLQVRVERRHRPRWRSRLART